MRHLLACLLISCFGLSLPAAGGSVCLCVASMIADACTPDCCECCDCGGETSSKDCDSCVKLEKLPEAPAPEPMPTVPLAPAVELDSTALGFLHREVPVALRFRHGADRIRGPASAHERRALLAIWRL